MRIPRTPTTSPTARFLADAIERSGKRQREIAQELGISKPNFISMMKIGESSVPIHHIPDLARVLGVDERQFLVTALMEYHPGLWNTLQRLYPPYIPAGAQQWLTAWLAWLEDIDITMDEELWADAIAALQAAEKRQRGRSPRL